MHVNQTAQYALRAMMALAGLRKGDTIAARDLSKSTGIPAAYLSKIMRRLSAAGLVLARKGHGGGFRLSRGLSRIKLRDVIEAAGGELERDVCIFGNGRCDPQAPCPLHDSWSELNEAFHTWARRTSLQDLRPLR